MKRRIKYCLFGVLLLLLNGMAMSAQTSTLSILKKSDVAYVTAQDNAVRLMHYIHKSQLCETISFDNQSNNLKYGIKTLHKSNVHGGDSQPRNLSCQPVHPDLHPNTIQYYIYTLEKIIT